MQRTRKAFAAEIVLGQHLEKMRRAHGMTRQELARRINVTDQQLGKYEDGAFVPLPVLEAIGEALDAPAPKKLIRRISNLRKLEIEKGLEKPELSEFYQLLYTPEAFDV